MGHESYKDRHKDRARRRRKERVLHTRVSERLDDTLRNAADELRVPVSNLVRNVLEDAFMVVETVAENLGDLVDDVLEEAERVRGQWKRHSWREPRLRHWRRGESRWGHGQEAAPQDDASEPPPEFPDVVGWQPLILNGVQACADCGRELRRGDRAFVGMAAGGPSSTWLCRECVQARA